VVLAVVATVKLSRRCVRAQPGGQHHPIRGAREARGKVRLPGEHGISRPTIAQGRPSDWHHLYAAVRFSCVCFSRSGPRVRGQHPAFPAPSWTRRAERPGKARANFAARTRRRVCVHTLAVIARLDRAIQYSETVMIEPRSRSVLDSPPSRGMTVVLGGRSRRLILRHCERSEAIQRLTAEAFWIASLRSQ